MKKGFKSFIGVYNEGNHKVFVFLFIRIKIKNKHKILLNALDRQQKHFDKNITDLTNQTARKIREAQEQISEQNKIAEERFADSRELLERLREELKTEVLNIGNNALARQQKHFAEMREQISGQNKIAEERFASAQDLLERVKRELKTEILNIGNFDSSEYWEDRYLHGGNSGAGSYSNLAEFKAKIINEFVQKHNVKSIIDFGCGDGNQLSLAKYDKYLGFDVSKTAVDLCRKKFAGDNSKEFRLMQNYNGEKAELTLSLDVIFHLLEDSVFDNYMKTLFGASEKFAIIYSSNKRGAKWVKHVRHRKFTDWIEKNAADWKLLEFIANPYHTDGDGSDPNTSFADFHIFGKR